VSRVAALGADVVLDHTTRDFTDHDATYDLFLDVVGRMPIGRCLRVLGPHGVYVRATVPGAAEVLAMLWANGTGRRRVVIGDAGTPASELAWLGGLVASGALQVPVDRRYGLDDLPAAHAYVDGGHKQGNVIVRVADLAR
jgi:NADPH:quinone reductase-like Zn-dependent oxidoreductase